MLPSIPAIQRQPQASSPSQCSKLADCALDRSIAFLALITFGALAVYQNIQKSCEQMLDDRELSCYDKACHTSYVERCKNEYDQSSRLLNYYLIPMGVATFSIMKLANSKRIASEQVRPACLPSFFRRIINNEQSLWSLRGFVAAATVSTVIRYSSILFPTSFPNPYCQTNQGSFCSLPSTSCTSMLSSFFLPQKVCDLSDAINNIEDKTNASLVGCSLLATLLIAATYRACIRRQTVNHANLMSAPIEVRTTVPVAPPYNVP